jgi:hypothetical protein
MEEVLVVFEFDVVAGLVFLDEFVFKDHRFFIVGAEDGVDVAEDPVQEPYKIPCVRCLSKIGGEPGA